MHNESNYGFTDEMGLNNTPNRIQIKLSTMIILYEKDKYENLQDLKTQN